MNNNFEDIELPSNFKFGLFFAAVFAGGAIYAWIYTSLTQLIWVLAVLSVVMFILAFLLPDLLLPLNKAWIHLGMLIGMVVSPIVMGLMFFILFTPVAFVMRLAGRDELRLKKTPRPSHWKPRVPAGPEPTSFNNQF